MLVLTIITEQILRMILVSPFALLSMLNVLLEDAKSSMFFMYHLFKHNYEIINIIMKLFHRVSLVKMNSGKPVVIGYWNARGLIQPIKLILEHLKILHSRYTKMWTSTLFQCRRIQT